MRAAEQRAEAAEDRAVAAEREAASAVEATARLETPKPGRDCNLIILSMKI